MVAPFDRKALWQGKNENHFRPYLITPFAVSNCVCSADAGLMSASDAKSFLISANGDLLHYSSTFCQSFFSLFGYFFRNRSLWIIYVNCYLYLFCMPRSSGRWYWGAFLPALLNAKPVPLGWLYQSCYPVKSLFT